MNALVENGYNPWKYGLKLTEFEKIIIHPKDSGGRRDIDVLIGDVTKKDYKLFFSSKNCSEYQRRYVYRFTEIVKLEKNDKALLLVQTGIEKSLSAARRNGWEGEFPKGFSEYEYGSKKHKITVLNMGRPKGSKNKIANDSSLKDVGTSFTLHKIPPLEEISDSLPKASVMLCGHEEIVHPVDCKVCWDGKRFCGLKWFRCGGHGEHVETDCEKLCT